MPNEFVDRERRLQEVLAGYLQDVEAGRKPDGAQLLAQHPDLADDLRSFLAGNEKMRQLVERNEAATLSEGASTVASVKVRYFGDYELLEEIGKGGMGLIYRARQVSLNRIIALKMILAGELATPADVRRFQIEAEAAANLDHPNIVPIYEVGEHEGQHFYSMKLIDGGSLQAVVSGQRPAAGKEDQRRAARLLATVARAVHHAHQRGILHRDLKPGNLLLDSQGEPHVADFGLAKRFLAPTESDSEATRSGTILGTPSYMPPEQARGDKVLSTAVDVYSLGAILYELLAGRPPFRGDNAMQTLMLIIEQEPPSPASVNPNARIDRDLQTICMKCLEKAPAQRYRSAEALAEDLERWQRGEPIAARPVSSPERLWRWCRRNPAVAATTSLAVLALVAAVAIGIVAALRDRQNSQRDLARERERLRNSYIEQARAERVAGNRERSLEAIRQAAVIRRDAELRFEAVAALTRPGLRLLSELGAVGSFRVGWLNTGPKFSPDGRLAAIWHKHGLPASAGERFGVYEIATGNRLGTELGKDVTPTKYWRNLAIAFRPGTTQLAMLSLDRGGCVVLWDYASGQEIGIFGQSIEAMGDEPGFNENKLRKAGPVIKRAEFSTDGSLLLTVNRLEVAQVWNVQTKQMMKVPARGQLLEFLSGHELLLLDRGRYSKWDCITGEQTWLTPAGLKAAGYSIPARRAAVFGQAPGEASPAMLLCDLVDGKAIGTIPGLSELPKRVDFSPNGHYAVFDDPADQGKSMRVWDLYLGRYTNRLSAPRGFTLSQEQRSFNPDGSLLLSSVVVGEGSSSADKLCIWDTTGVIVDTLPAADYVWSGDGQRLTTFQGNRGQGIVDASLRCWEVTRPLPTYDLGRAIKSLSLNRDGNLLVVNQFVCKLENGVRSPELVGWQGNPKGLFPQFAADEECWSAELIQRGTPSRFFGGPTYPRPDRAAFGAGIAGLLGSPSGPLLACSALFPRTFEAYPISIYDTKLWQLTPSLREVKLPDADYSEQVKAAADLARSRAKDPREVQFDSVATMEWVFSPTAPLFLRLGMVQCRVVTQPWEPGENAIAQPVLELWNYREGKRLVGRREYASLFRFSPDGRRIALLRNAKIEILDAATFQVERELTAEGMNSFFTKKLTFLPDSRRLLVMNAQEPYGEERHCLFDVETGQELKVWKFKNGEFLTFAVSPDGKLAASGGGDKVLHLWDVASGRELARWPGHEGGVTALLFSPDSQTLFSGSQDGTLKLWHLPFIHQQLQGLILEW